MSILVYYQTYQGYISKYLCENRYVPESDCNGQCYLMKKLRKAEEGKSTPVVPDISKSDFLIQDLLESKPIDRSENPDQVPTEKVFLAGNYMTRIFHPPIV